MEEDIKFCPNCGNPLSVEMENNGFTMPEGPEKWEASGYKCNFCGDIYSFDEIEEIEEVIKQEKENDNNKRNA